MEDWMKIWGLGVVLIWIIAKSLLRDMMMSYVQGEDEYKEWKWWVEVAAIFLGVVIATLVAIILSFVHYQR